ncbi:MAG: response regulator, partial [Lachnospiraceae bacterium]|nr:response regulator [Lachnospiraceae bacterium]
EEDKDRLFETFTRLEETRNRNIEGTGLGMSIVNRLLDMMGSKLEVSSTYGKGSEFSFAVDQGIINGEPIGDYEKKAREALGSEDNDRYPYAPEARVLIVDDSSMNIKVMKSLMKLNGISPEAALSGQEALEKLKDAKYDVVMLDHMMPQMDGIETLQKAKEEKLIPEGCIVIALTANAVVGAREAYLEAGFDDYLSKPVEVAALEGILVRYIPPDKMEFRNRPKKKAKKQGAENV